MKRPKNRVKEAINFFLSKIGLHLISIKKYQRLCRRMLLHEQIICDSKRSQKNTSKADQESSFFAFYRYGILERKEKDGFNYLWMTHDEAGIFSCLTTAMWTVLQIRGEGQICHSIDNSFSMSSFKKNRQENTWSKLFTPRSKVEIEAIMDSKPCSTLRFDHHGNYSEIVAKHLGIDWAKSYIKAYMTPSKNVQKIADFFIRKYEISERTTIAVCYRGTDKHKEVAPSPLSEYYAKVDEILKSEPNCQILIQTDQKQVRDEFKKKYTNMCLFIEELPVTARKIAIHKQHIKGLGKDKFAKHLYSMCIAISASKYVITHTGNVGFFLALHTLLFKNTLIQLR